MSENFLKSYHMPEGFFRKTPAEFRFQLSPHRGDNPSAILCALVLEDYRRMHVLIRL